MSKNNPPDSESFRAAVGPVRPLKADDRHREPRPKPVPRKSRHKQLEDLESDAANPAQPALLAKVAEACQAGKALLRAGLQRRVLRQIGSRECPLEDSFDLHGMNERAAAHALSRFLKKSLADGLECVRIVHGKGLRSGGLAVLKLMAWQQVWQHPAVLAIKPCAAADGGSGAILVLLKNHRECC